MFKLFEIREGKFNALPTLNPKYIKGFIIVSIIGLIIAAFSDKLNIDEKQLWKIYTAIIQRLGLKQDIPDLPDNQKKLDAKVELEVDRALNEYMRLTGDNGTVKIKSPIFSEKPIDEKLCYTDECKSLGGEIRLCSPWIEDCVNKI